MRRRALAALLALLSAAAADAADVRLMAHETRAMSAGGASAAFAVDASVVNVSVEEGRLILVALHAGETLVSLVHPDRVETIAVHIEPAPSRLPRVVTQRRRNSGQIAVSHDTGLDRSGLDVALQLNGSGRETRIRFQAIHEGAAAGKRAVALPSASIELKSGDRKVTLLDEYVEASPLTIDGTVLRGVHASNGKAELHAGVASTQPWDDLLLPAQGDRAASLSWHLQRNALAFVPSLLWLPDAQTRVPGVASLRVARGGPEDALQAGAELGWSDVPGVSFDIALNQPQRQAWLRGSYRPREFAALDLARPAGSHLEGAWAERIGQETQASLSVSANRLELGTRDPRAATAQLDVRKRVAPRWTLTGGLGGSDYRENGAAATRRTASVGAAYDADGFGVQAQYRYQQASGFDSGGHGARLALRAQRDGFRANAYLDAQQNAAGLAFDVAPGSGIGRALAELGVVAGSPEDILRLLREHAALFERYGVTLSSLRLDPLRLQAGLDLLWQGSSARRARAGLRMFAEESRGLTDRRRTALATAYAGWRLSNDLDLEIGYSRWALRNEGGTRDEHDSVQVVIRKYFDGFALPGAGRRAIRGRVLQDALGHGEPLRGAAPLGGVEVVLDGQRRTRTDAEGRFEFDAPGPGEHQVSATLPEGVAGYFTGPSTRTLQAGGEAHFAVLPAPARIAGRVVSDAGQPLAGVTVRLSGAVQGSATTDSGGAFRFATAPGEVELVLAAESVPEGFDVGDLKPLTRHVELDSPATADFVLRAQRSLRGAVQGMQPGTQVVVPALGRSVAPDAQGRFVLRSLPAGPVTLVVRRGASEVSQVVELPAAPGRVDGVLLRGP